MLRIYVDAATKGNPGESGGGIVTSPTNRGNNCMCL